MNNNDDSRDRLREDLQSDRKELTEFQHTELVIEGEEHHGFSDAVRATRLRSQVEALDTHIHHEETWLKSNGG